MTNKAKKVIYVLSPKISYKTYKLIQEKLVRPPDIKIQHIDWLLWKMLQEKKIYCWFSDDLKEDMGIGLKLPKYDKVIIIKDVEK